MSARSLWFFSELGRIEVQGPLAALSWLREFLGPSFLLLGTRDGVQPGAPPRCADVAMEVDPEARAAALAEIDVRGRDGIEAFTLDGEFSEHRGFEDARGHVWIDDPMSETVLDFDASRTRVRILAASGEGRPRLALMRAVREYATVAALRDGGLPLHASAFGAGETLYLVLGPKRSGKTSLLLHALRCGARFLSNDRVMFAREIPFAVPTIVMLRDGTLEMFPEFREAFEAAAYDRTRTIRECDPGVPRDPPRAGRGFDRPGISPSQFAHIFGAPFADPASERRLLFPSIDPAARGVEFLPIFGERVLERLAPSLLRPSHPIRTSPLFAREPFVLSPEDEAELCVSFVRRSPAFEVRLGPDAYEGNLLDALEAGTTG